MTPTIPSFTFNVPMAAYPPLVQAPTTTHAASTSSLAATATGNGNGDASSVLGSGRLSNASQARSLELSSNYAQSFRSSLHSTDSPFGAVHTKHRLHSIPPRGKSVKTQILDQTVWLHSNTRFTQIRTELALNESEPETLLDRAAISNDALFQALRYDIRPFQSDGTQTIHRRTEHADLARIRALRARAEGLERVLGAMMARKPSSTADTDSIHTTGSSSFRNSSSDQEIIPPITRIRIELGSLVNDLFSHHRELHQKSYHTASSQLYSIPGALSTLSNIHLDEPSRSVIPQPSTSPSSSIPKKPVSKFHSISFAQPLGIVGAPYHFNTYEPQLTPEDTSRGSSRAGSHGSYLFSKGVQSQAGSGTFKAPCTRHRRVDCQVCSAPFMSTTSIGSGLSRDRAGKSFRHFLGQEEERDRSDGPMKSHVAELVPHFLKLSALIVTELGRDKEEPENTPTEDARAADIEMLEYLDEGTFTETSTSSSPRLFSSENGGETTRPTTMENGMETDEDNFGSPVKENANEKLQQFRPSRLWLALLAALLTEAVLEGYTLKEWKGTQAAEILLSIGCTNSEQGKGDKGKKRPKVKSLFSWMSNEDTPTSSTTQSRQNEMNSIVEAAEVLFGSLDPKDSNVHMKEYQKVMGARLEEILHVSPNCNDLSTHLEALAQRYPIEALELAALLFCETVSEWLGIPEVYKSKGASNAVPHTTIGGSFKIPSVPISSPPQTVAPPALHAVSDPTQTPKSSASRRLSISSVVHPPFASSISLSSSFANTDGVVDQPHSSRLTISEYFAEVMPSDSTAFGAPQTTYSDAQTQKKPKAKTTGGKFSMFILGDKRPRDIVNEPRAEGERNSKKPIFPFGGSKKDRKD